MNAATDVPVTISAEAEARIAELGMRRELEQMIAHIRAVVPELTAIKVMIAECYDTREETGVSVIAYSDRVFEAGENASEGVDRWAVQTFPPQVLEHLCILFSPGNPNAR